MNSAASDVAERASSAASKASDMVTSITQAAWRQAQGNPLAAGLIAFGQGWLVSSLLPPSRKERELASQATNAVSQQVQPLAPQLGQTAQGMTQNLQSPRSRLLSPFKQPPAAPHLPLPTRVGPWPKMLRDALSSKDSLGDSAASSSPQGRTCNCISFVLASVHDVITRLHACASALACACEI